MKLSPREKRAVDLVVGGCIVLQGAVGGQVGVVGPSLSKRN